MNRPQKRSREYQNELARVRKLSDIFSEAGHRWVHKSLLRVFSENFQNGKIASAGLVRYVKACRRNQIGFDELAVKEILDDARKGLAIYDIVGDDNVKF
jgi:hypothetical protein